jgi:hypothetical protein
MAAKKDNQSVEECSSVESIVKALKRRRSLEQSLAL